MGWQRVRHNPRFLAVHLGQASVPKLQKPTTGRERLVVKRSPSPGGLFLANEVFPPFSAACLLEPRLGSRGGEEGRGGKSWHESLGLLSVSALSKPQLKFQDLCSLVFSTKRNHNNQQLEKWVEEAKEEKEKQRKTQQHPWPAVFFSGTPGVAARVTQWQLCSTK